MSTFDDSLKSQNVFINKKFVRLDVIGPETNNNELCESKHIILSEDHEYVNTDLYSVYQYDYCNTINFGSNSTLTYYLINKLSGVLCRINGSNTDIFIHFPENLTVYDYNYKNFQVFYDHVNNIFVFDVILSDKSFLNMSINFDISSIKELKNFKYSIVSSPTEPEYIPSSLYQLNNHSNLIAIKDGGLILSSKIKSNDSVVEYRNKIYGKTEQKNGLRSWFSSFKTEKTNNFIIENTECLKNFVTSVVLLPGNRVVILNDELDLILLKLNGFDNHLSELEEGSLSLEVLSKVNILETFIPTWKSGVINSFLECKAQINSDFTKFVFYLPNSDGNYLLAELNYDIQSINNEDLVNTLSGFKYLEDEFQNFTTVKIDFDFVDYKISNNNEVYCLLKGKSFSTQAKNEFVVMKYYSGKWTKTFQDQITKINHIEQLEAIDVTELTTEQKLDLSITFEFCYKLDHKQLYDENDNFIFQTKESWFNFITELKKQHLERIGEPCGLSFKNAESGLLSVNLKNYHQFDDNISSYYLPAFKLPLTDQNDFFKMIKKVCNVFTLSENSLSTTQLINECLKENQNEINLNILKSKYELINIQEFVLYLNTKDIEDIILTLEELSTYSIGIDPTITTSSTIKQAQILMDYVYYKNSQLINLYLNILLCFKYVEINNEKLIEVLKNIVDLLKKRFKFDKCYKFNKMATLEIFIKQNGNLNLNKLENLIISSEYLLYDFMIKEYSQWNIDYQIYHLKVQRFTKNQLQNFLNYIQTFDYDDKIKNIALLNAMNFEKVIETCFFETNSLQIDNSKNEYDAKTLKLLETQTSFEYLTSLFTIFIDYYKDLSIADNLSHIIVDNFISNKKSENESKTQLIFYKYYIKLISEYGKYDEILVTLLTTDSLLSYEDKYEIYDTLLSRFGIQYLKSIIQYNYKNSDILLPFNQFDIVKKIVFNAIKKEKEGFTLIEYVKLLLSYDDKRGALKILFYLITEENSISAEDKDQYKTMLISLLYTLPKEDRWVVDYTGTTIRIEHILNI